MLTAPVTSIFRQAAGSRGRKGSRGQKGSRGRRESRDGGNPGGGHALAGAYPRWWIRGSITLQGDRTPDPPHQTTRGGRPTRKRAGLAGLWRRAGLAGLLRRAVLGAGRRA